MSVVHSLTHAIGGFLILKIMITVFTILVVRFLYNLILKPFFELRAYKSIPGTLIRYRIGPKKIWEHNNAGGEPIPLNKDVPFHVTENNTLLLNNPNLRAIISNIAKTPQVLIIDHELGAEMIKHHENYEHFRSKTMIGKRYSHHALLFVTGNEWKKQRKIISRAFDFESMQKIIPIVQDVAKELFTNEPFKDGKELLALRPIFLKFTWEAFSRSFFGDNLKSFEQNGETFGHHVNELIKEQVETLFTPQYQLFGEFAALWNSKVRDQKRKVRQIGKLGEKIIEEMKGRIKRGEIKSPDGRKGILELILESSQGSDETLTNAELLGNFFLFSFAGSDTSANTLANLIYCVATNPETKKKTIEDIQTHWDGVSPITQDALNKMEYLHALILETLRVMSPVAGILPRVALNDHMIGDIPVKKGYIVQALSNATLFSPKWIKNPEVFQPERWIKRNEAYQQLADVFIFNPFSFGGRACIGQHFAMTQVKLALCYFLPKFEFNLPPDFKLAPMVTRATLEPKELVKMFIKPISN